MKIVVINGQNHKGSSYQLGNIFLENIKTDKEVTEFFLPRDLNHFCIGCFSCIQDETKCPFYEEKRKILDAVDKADILIFTTPTYCLRSSAPIKTFIDLTFTYWMVHKPRIEMFSKKAYIFSTAAGHGTKSAMKDIKTCLLYWGVPYIKTYGKSIQASSWNSVNTKRKEKIEKDIKALASKVNTNKPHVGLKTKFLFSLMRLNQLNNTGASKKEREYWENQGWLEKTRPWKK